MLLVETIEKFLCALTRHLGHEPAAASCFVVETTRILGSGVVQDSSVWRTKPPMIVAAHRNIPCGLAAEQVIRRFAHWITLVFNVGNKKLYSFGDETLFLVQLNPTGLPLPLRYPRKLPNVLSNGQAQARGNANAGVPSSVNPTLRP